MKHFLLLIFSLVIITSCKNHRQASHSADAPTEMETPKASQEDSYSLGFTKSRGRDIIDELYNELLQKDSSLDQLEKSIDKFRTLQKDSLEAFNHFDQKNQAFYDAAKYHLSSIKDSLLKQEIAILIDK